MKIELTIDELRELLASTREDGRGDHVLARVVRQKKILCPECATEFRSPAGLGSHMRIHEKVGV